MRTGAEKSFVFLRTQRVRLGIAVFRGDGTGPSGTAAGTGRTGAGRVLVGHGADVESHAIVAGVVPTMELAQRGRLAQGHGLPHVAAEEGHCAERLPGLLHPVSLLAHQKVMQQRFHHRLDDHRRERRHRSRTLENRERKQQHAQNQGLSSGAQLRPRQETSLFAVSRHEQACLALPYLPGLLRRVLPAHPRDLAHAQDLLR